MPPPLPDMRLAPHSWMAFVPNGAGKTTSFNLISGIFPLDQGTIHLDDCRIDQLPARKRIGVGLSRSFQNIRLMSYPSVIENVMLGQHSQIGSLGGLLTPIGCMRNHPARHIAIGA